MLLMHVLGFRLYRLLFRVAVCKCLSKLVDNVYLFHYSFERRITVLFLFSDQLDVLLDL